MSETIYTGPKPPESNVAPRQLTEDDIKRWDKNMKRAFKGVVMGGRPTARAMLMRTSEASDA
jgi:hypothetical protein